LHNLFDSATEIEIGKAASQHLLDVFAAANTHSKCYSKQDGFIFYCPSACCTGTFNWVFFQRAASHNLSAFAAVVLLRDHLQLETAANSRPAHQMTNGKEARDLF